MPRRSSTYVTHVTVHVIEQTIKCRRLVQFLAHNRGLSVCSRSGVQSQKNAFSDQPENMLAYFVRFLFLELIDI